MEMTRTRREAARTLRFGGLVLVGATGLIAAGCSGSGSSGGSGSGSNTPAPQLHGMFQPTSETGIADLVFFDQSRYSLRRLLGCAVKYCEEGGTYAFDAAAGTLILTSNDGRASSLTISHEETGSDATGLQGQGLRPLGGGGLGSSEGGTILGGSSEGGTTLGSSEGGTTLGSTPDGGTALTVMPDGGSVAIIANIGLCGTALTFGASGVGAADAAAPGTDGGAASQAADGGGGCADFNLASSELGDYMKVLQDAENDYAANTDEPATQADPNLRIQGGFTDSVSNLFSQAKILVRTINPCNVLQPFTQVTNMEYAYYFQGLDANVTVDVATGTGSLDLVYDLWDEQAGWFLTTAGGANVTTLFGASAGVHAGFGWGRGAESDWSIINAWPGNFVSYSAGISFPPPFDKTGASVGGFRTTDGNVEGFSLEASVGVGFGLPVSVMVEYGSTGAWNKATEVLARGPFGGTIQSASYGTPPVNGEYVQFGSDYTGIAGMAGSILVSAGPETGALPAALLPAVQFLKSKKFTVASVCH